MLTHNKIVQMPSFRNLGELIPKESHRSQPTHIAWRSGFVKLEEINIRVLRLQKHGFEP